MLDAVQTTAVTTANVLAPGTGVIVNAGFELGKILFDIGAVLIGVKEKADAFKAQLKIIEEDVDEFEHVVELLARVQNQAELTQKLQQTILKFYAAVQEYNRVVTLDRTRSRFNYKQFFHRSDLLDASDAARKTAIKVKERLATECAIDASPTHGARRAPRSVEELRAEREKWYKEFVDSPEIVEELSDPDNQKDVLATMTRMRCRKSAQDPVLHVMRDKAHAASSIVVRAEVDNLPEWYTAESDVKLVDALKIGFGGDAQVCKAFHAGMLVAVKIYNVNNSIRDEKTKQRVMETSKVWNRLQHTYICRFYGACYLSEKPFAVMEFCDGGSLEKYLRRFESSRPHVALDMLIHAAHGLLKMHSLGIVHNDFKADNILIDKATKRAKVSDFDRSFDWKALKTKRLENGIAEAAGVEISGAVRWLAPECIEGKVPSTASDVYSFGMTIYEAVMGEIPYSDASQDEEVKACVLAHELPARDAKKISDGAWELITQCCDPDPHKRPTMDEVVESLMKLSIESRGVFKDKESEVESQVDATMDVSANTAAVASTDVVIVLGGNGSANRKQLGGLTPIKTQKTGFWLKLKSRKMVALGVFILTALGVAGGLLGRHFSSSTKAPASVPSDAPTNGSVTSRTFVTSFTIWNSSSTFSQPSSVRGIAASSDGDVYVSEGNRILQWRNGSGGSVLSGKNGVGGYVDSADSALAQYSTPGAMAVSSSGDIYICDSGNMRIRKITRSTSAVTTFPVVYGSPIAIDSNDAVYVAAGSGVTRISSDGNTVISDFAKVPASGGFAVDTDGAVYFIAENSVKKMSVDGFLTVVAGSGSSGYLDGTGDSSQLSGPMGLAMGSDGNLYIADTGNHCIRKVTLATNEVTTYAGVCKTTGKLDGPATSATFYYPSKIAARATTNELYVTSSSQGLIRKIYTIT